DEEPFQRAGVVPREVVHVGAVLGDQATVAGRAPGVRAVVGTGDFEDFGAPGDFARDHHGPGGEIGAVFGKHGPVGEVDAGDERLGQFDHQRGGVVETRAAGAGGVGGGLDLGMMIPEHERSVAAEKVDVVASIDVGVAAAVAVFGEVGHGAGHGGGGRGVAVRAAAIG